MRLVDHEDGVFQESVALSSEDADVVGQFLKGEEPRARSRREDAGVRGIDQALAHAAPQPRLDAFGRDQRGRPGRERARRRTRPRDEIGEEPDREQAEDLGGVVALVGRRRDEEHADGRVPEGQEDREPDQRLARARRVQREEAARFADFLLRGPDAGREVHDRLTDRDGIFGGRAPVEARGHAPRGLEHVHRRSPAADAHADGRRPLRELLAHPRLEGRRSHGRRRVLDRESRRRSGDFFGVADGSFLLLIFVLGAQFEEGLGRSPGSVGVVLEGESPVLARVHVL